MEPVTESILVEAFFSVSSNLIDVIDIGYGGNKKKTLNLPSGYITLFF